MEFKKIWKKMESWKKSSIVGLLVGFLPWHLIFLFLPWEVYSKERLLQIWVYSHLLISILFTVVWFLLNMLLIYLYNRKANTKLFLIIFVIIYVAIIYNFILFELSAWGLTEI